MKKTFRRACRILCFMLMVCTVLAALPMTARAEGDPYISRVDLSTNVPDYKAGDTPRATASVTSGDCHVAYECWREMYQKEEGGVWYARAWWYSDPDKMAKLSDNQKFTQFEAGKEYSRYIVLEADLGHIFSALDTLEVYVDGSEFAFTRTNLAQEDMGMTTFVYGVNWLSVPAEDTVITDVNISGINKSLDAASPVQFTAQVADADQMTIAEEAWEKSTYGEDPPVDDIIKSTDADADRYPIEGGEYWYSVTLTAKDGYVFSDAFNDSDYAGRVAFVVDGKNYSGCTYVKDNGKTLVAWEFMSPVTAINSTPSVTEIGDVDIEGVKFDYAPGDAPAASGRKLDPYDEYYDIEYEYWEQMEETSPGVMEPVAFWYSDPAKNAALPENKRITSFEEGKTYMYSVSLVARDNCEFSENSRVMVNGSFVDARNVSNSTNRLFVTAIRTIKPETLHSQAIDLIEINGASLSFSAGDKPVFTGSVPEGAPYVYQHERWVAADGKSWITSADFWNHPGEGETIIDAFKENETYTYGLYFKASAGYHFTRDTRLKVNGKFVSYTVSYTSVDDPDFMPTYWITTDIALTPEADGYRVIEGADSVWTRDSGLTLRFRANGDFDRFSHLLIDGTPLPQDRYTAVSGSTIVQIKASCLNELAVGKHKVTFVYRDGECSADFTIQASGAAPDKPAKTGDTASPALWIALAALAAANALAAVYFDQKRRQSA